MALLYSWWVDFSSNLHGFCDPGYSKRRHHTARLHPAWEAATTAELPTKSAEEPHFATKIFFECQRARKYRIRMICGYNPYREIRTHSCVQSLSCRIIGISPSIVKAITFRVYGYPKKYYNETRGIAPLVFAF